MSNHSTRMPAPQGAGLPGPKALGRAHGKTILLGEHAVVYGHPALAAALRQSMVVTLEPHPGPAWLDAPDIGVSTPLCPTPSHPDPSAPQALALRQALIQAAGLLEVPLEGYRLHVRGDIPVGRGAGSSAALSIASLRAFAQFFGRDLPVEPLLTMGHTLEQHFHGRASGIDHTVATLGGVLEYTRGTPMQVRRIHPAVPLPLLLLDAGEAPPTALQVAQVAARLEREPQRCRDLFAGIGSLVQRGIRAVEAGDLATLGAVMNENQTCLRALEVSSPALEHVIALALSEGATAAKLTGAGGGGLALALCPDGLPRIAAALRSRGVGVFETWIGPDNQTGQVDGRPG